MAGRLCVSQRCVFSFATLHLSFGGGQQGNKNSAGHASSVPKRNKNAEKHGAFSKLYFIDIDEDEWELINCMGDAEEEQLILQFQLFSIRERRLMNSIKRYRDMEADNHGLAVDGVAKTKKIEDIIDEDGESIDSGKYKKVTETTVSNTKSVMNSIITLEAELTKVQKAKTKAIETLGRMRLEKQKLEGESAGNDVVDDWIAGIIGEDDNG